MNDAVISRGVRAQLSAVKQTASSIAHRQERISTGKKVNSAVDDAIAFFKARDLTFRASDLASTKAQMTGAIAVISASISGLESVEAVLKQMKALAQTAIATPTSTARAGLASQFIELRSQVDGVLADASFDGINLLKGSFSDAAMGDRLTVKFNERTGSRAVNQLLVSGLSDSDVRSILVDTESGQGGASATQAWGQSGPGALAAMTSAIRAIDSALATVRQSAHSFGTLASLIEARRKFTNEIIGTLRDGAAALVDADLNEESANLLSLQTRQQLGMTALGLRGGSLTSLLERLL
ncbi:MAG: flagellin [Rhodospirillaceae bacterium]|nr:flagellin [Rhodospirillaceae bacterium]